LFVSSLDSPLLLPADFRSDPCCTHTHTRYFVDTSGASWGPGKGVICALGSPALSAHAGEEEPEAGHRFSMDSVEVRRDGHACMHECIACMHVCIDRSSLMTTHHIAIDT